MKINRNLCLQRYSLFSEGEYKFITGLYYNKVILYKIFDVVDFGTVPGRMSVSNFSLGFRKVYK